MEKLQTHPVAIANRDPFVLRLPSLQEPLEIGGQLVLVCSADLRRRVEVQRLLVGHQRLVERVLVQAAGPCFSRGVLKAFWQGLGAPGLGWF